MIITVKILEQDNFKTELYGNFEDRRITIDPCVGCAIPHSIFRDYDFTGKTYTFDGSWYSHSNEDLFLPQEMYDPLEK